MSFLVLIVGCDYGECQINEWDVVKETRNKGKWENKGNVSVCVCVYLHVYVYRTLISAAAGLRSSLVEHIRKWIN